MFNISQTGNSLKRETLVHPDDRTLLKTLTEHASVPIRINDTLPEGANALYRPEERDIHIRRGMTADNIFRALSQELAHAETDKGDGSYFRADYAFHAYCASYILCKQYDVDTSCYRFDNAPDMLEGLTPQAIRAELSVMREAAAEISGRMNRTLNPQRQHNRREATR